MAARRRGWRRREVIAATNALRVEHGLKPLRAHWRLTRAAVHYAQDMSRTGVFAHTAQDGRTWIMRIRATGDAAPAGENIAWGQDTPAEVVGAWMESPEHRANLLNGKFRRIGVGYAPGRNTWVQDFGY